MIRYRKRFAGLVSIIVTAAGLSYATTTTTTTQAEQQTTAPEPAPLFQMHYENRVRSFKEQNLMLQNVVLLGDSITEGFDVTRYLPGRRVLNRGIGADVIGNALPANDKRGLTKRLDSSVFDCSPTDVFILIGINDLGQGHSPETIEAGYRQLLSQIRDRLPKVNLHVQSILPCRDRFAKHNENIIDVNGRLKNLADEFGCSYIDLHTQFADQNGQLKDEFTNDGLHLTPDGYEVWKQVLLKKMKWN